MNILQAFLLGIIQGISEFLPISSSGHLVLLQNLFSLNGSQLTFNILVHFATLLAVIIFFWKKLLSLNFKEISIILIANIPTAVVGFLLKDKLEFIFSKINLVALMLIVTAIFNFISDKKLNKQASTKNQSPSIKQAGIIGLFQALAIIPGISRSGSTIFAGLISGLNRFSAFEFSFLLSLPAIAGASFLQILSLFNNSQTELNFLVLFTGFIAAFITGLLSLSLFKKIINKAKLEIFAWYCLILGLLSLYFNS